MMPHIKFMKSAAKRREKNSLALCDFITFDYRGVRDSKRRAWRADDLVLDADVVLQFVKETLKKPDYKIHILTFSLGEGVGAKLKSLHPELIGSITNLNSYSSLKDVADNMLGLGSLVKHVSWDLPTIDY